MSAELICRLSRLGGCAGHGSDLVMSCSAPVQFDMQEAPEAACCAKAGTKDGERSLQKFSGLNYVFLMTDA